MKFQLQPPAVYIFVILMSLAFCSQRASAQVLDDASQVETVSQGASIQSNIPIVLPTDDTDNPSLNTVSKPISTTHPTSLAKGFKDYDQNKPVDLSADSLAHDEILQIITASGSVKISQEGRTINADQVNYNLKTDTVIAEGNIIIHEPNGDVFFADKIQLTNKMREGRVESLKGYLSDGGVFTAKHGERIDQSVIIMNDASYTACDCDKDNDGNPAWALKAKEITYDKNEHDVTYKSAWFEVSGVPVAFTPFFMHSDGQVDRQSGFLTPRFEYDSKLGFIATPRYYWDIAPNKDATFGLMLMNNELPVLLSEYRHRLDQAEILLDGSVSYSKRTESDAGLDVRKEQQIRGHLFTEGRWDIDQKLRAGVILALTSDAQYLRQFDISSRDILENEIFLERFSGRNYSVIRALAFQDTRIRNESRDIDQPNLFPEIITTFYGEPNKVFGGRWSFEASALGLYRNEGDQDLNRLTAELGWQRRFNSNIGITATTELKTRTDFYHVNDREVATPGSGRSTSGIATRAFVQSHTVASYPFVKALTRAQALIEPILSLTFAPDVDSSGSDFPNEDSQDVQIDTSNIFEPSRFPGKDKIEDKSRATYGVRAGIYGHNDSQVDVFLAQSHRFNKDGNPFSNGSGLDESFSDVVGQVSVLYSDLAGLNYRFQLDNHNLSSQRHELDSFVQFGRLRLSNRYLFAKVVKGTSIDESREQFSSSASLRASDNWLLKGSALFDLGAEPGLRKSTLGIDYIGCCVFLGLTAERNLTSKASGDSSTEVTVRIGLKNLGDFSSGSESYGIYSSGMDR